MDFQLKNTFWEFMQSEAQQFEKQQYPEMRLVFWMQLTYSVPSILLYIIVITIILRDRKQYSGAFYKIFVFSAVVNTGVFLNTLFSLRVPNNTCKDCALSIIYSAFPFPKIIPFFQWLSYEFGFSQFFVIFLTCFNRFTAVFVPLRHEKLWNIIFIPMCFMAMFGPTVFTFELLLKPASFVYLPSIDGYSMRTEAKASDIFFRNVIFDAVMTILTTIINIYSVILIRRMGKGFNSQNPLEKSMFRISIANFIIQVVVAVMVVLLYVQAYDADMTMLLTAFIRLMLPYISDILTLSNPWLMVVFNSSIRASIFGFYKTRTSGAGSVIISSHQQTRVSDRRVVTRMTCPA